MFLSSLSTLVFYGAHKALKKAAVTPSISHSWSLFPEVQWLMRPSLPHELRGFTYSSLLEFLRGKEDGNDPRRIFQAG